MRFESEVGPGVLLALKREKNRVSVCMLNDKTRQPIVMLANDVDKDDAISIMEDVGRAFKLATAVLAEVPNYCENDDHDDLDMF